MKINGNPELFRVADLGNLAASDGPAIPDPGRPSPLTTSAVSTPVRLTGSTARRLPSKTEHVVWDDELPGFGLRIRPTGHKTWIVQHRRRGKLVKVTLGPVGQLAASDARAKARGLLVDVALDGLPRRGRARSAAPTFADYVEPFWQDYSRHWKPATQRRNRHAIDNDLLPVFGANTLDAIRRADIQRWRDDMSARQGVFNRALPVLAIMLAYAEQLGHRPRGSNPCRGTPRYKRTLPERYLSPVEYRRLGAVLSEAEPRYATAVAILRLLMLTGARVSEIATLRWDYVQPPRLQLPDSKTGPKTVYLNSSAAAVLAGISQVDGISWVFPDRTGDRPYPLQTLDKQWRTLRRRAALPDVRMHDLRHSYASAAIGANVSLTIIGGLLGHALPETTARYAHLSDAPIADAAQRVCSTLAGYLEAGR